MAKIRIYELAKELGVENKFVLGKVQELGIPGKTSHSNSLDSDQADQVRRAVIRQAIGNTPESKVVKRVVDSSTGEKKTLVESRKGNIIRRRRKTGAAAEAAEAAEEEAAKAASEESAQEQVEAASEDSQDSSESRETAERRESKELGESLFKSTGDAETSQEAGAQSDTAESDAAAPVAASSEDSDEQEVAAAASEDNADASVEASASEVADTPATEPVIEEPLNLRSKPTETLPEAGEAEEALDEEASDAKDPKKGPKVLGKIELPKEKRKLGNVLPKFWKEEA